MKQFSFVLFMVGALLMSFAASAQEVSFRNGVITGISPIQVAAAQSSQRQSATKSAAGRAFGRSLGRLAGRAMAKVGGGEYAGDAYDVASGVAQDAVAGNANQTAGATTTGAMIIVKFDGGGETGFQMPSADGFRVGQKVRVLGSGSDARIVPR